MCLLRYLVFMLSFTTVTVASHNNKENFCSNIVENTIAIPHGLDDDKNYSNIKVKYIFVAGKNDHLCDDKIDRLEFIIEDQILYTRKWSEIVTLGHQQCWNEFLINSHNKMIQITFHWLTNRIVICPKPNFQSFEHVRRNFNKNYNDESFKINSLHKGDNDVFIRLWQPPRRLLIPSLNMSKNKLKELTLKFFINTDGKIDFERQADYANHITVRTAVDKFYEN